VPPYLLIVHGILTRSCRYPGYRYQPVYRRTNVIRRRVRKDEAEEEKCRSVAELLIKGKSGEELESEIREKIRKGPNVPSAKKRSVHPLSVSFYLHLVEPAPIPCRSASKKNGAAVALSKGALRALRAQSRQQASGDWSDAGTNASIGASRANSLAPSLADSGVNGKCVGGSGNLESEASTRGSVFTESEGGFGLGLDSRRNSLASEVNVEAMRVQQTWVGNGYSAVASVPYVQLERTGWLGQPDAGYVLSDTSGMRRSTPPSL
jgi:hypothetical protein